MDNREYLHTGILSTLKYFHAFRHPLSLEEIHRFLPVNASYKDLQDTIFNMLAAGSIYYIDGYYLLENNNALITERIAGGIRAKVFIKNAHKSVAIISKFPFVNSVCISGSLSKGYANEKSDIDLFIVTQKNRLWICRTILHLYKKMTFLWGKEHSFCMNYFIDESRLCIEEQNIFTATELATLIPVYNAEMHRELIQANKWWLVNILPNIPWNSDMTNAVAEKTTLRIALESILNIFAPKYLNLALMRITDIWWRNKWMRRKFPMNDYDLAMKTRWYVSKNHPLNYQKKVLKQIQNNTKAKAAAAIF